jgi:ribokinase
MPAPAICIVGSINLDMNAYVQRFPKGGETLHGERFTTGYGGKGANQAVMAARLGATVSVIGRVGDDLFGKDMRANLKAEGIGIEGVRTSGGVSSGVAVITVNEKGENTIVVVAGANGQVSAADVEASWDVIASSRVLVCQLEVPLEANLAAMRRARDSGVLTIFNPAPAVTTLPDEIFELSNICCPNETEAEILTGITIKSNKDAEAAARKLLDRGARNVIVTLGSRGSLLVNQAMSEFVPAVRVKAVDTTGAGDAFVGSLAFFTAQGKPLVEAMQRASQIAALSVQAHGTQSSFPHGATLPAELGE